MIELWRRWVAVIMKQVQFELLLCILNLFKMLAFDLSVSCVDGMFTKEKKIHLFSNYELDVSDMWLILVTKQRRM